MHLAHVADCLILLPVRLKGNTPVEEDFQIGPHLMQAGLARFLEHFPENDEKPRGHTAQVGHILSYRRLNKQRQLFGPIFHKCNLAIWYARQIGQQVHTLDKVGTQVPYPNTRFQTQVVGKTAAQNESLAREDATRRVEVQIMGHHVTAALVVIPAEGLPRDGDILAASVARARRLRKIHATPWPQFILGAVDHAHNVGLQILVGEQGQGRGKLAVGPDG